VDTSHDEGWIKLYRKSVHSQVFQNEGLWKVWTWCLLKANHEDNWASIKTGKGNTEVLVKRGQFIFGRKTAAKELKMPGRTVHYRMLKLADMQNLAIQTDTHYSKVTVLNYDAYQSMLEDDMTGTLTGNGQATDTNKNDKNEKKNISRSKKQTDPRVTDFLKYWGESFQKEIGEPYPFSFNKDGRMAKDLLKLYSPETLEEVTKAFFKDEWCKCRGFSFGLFRGQLGRLLSKKAVDPLEQARREQEG